jgi:hypothetical protein
MTDPNDKGRRYRHGTMSGYSAGKCRCQHCNASYAIYRAGRGSAGPRVRGQGSTARHPHG